MAKFLAIISKTMTGLVLIFEAFGLVLFFQCFHCCSSLNVDSSGDDALDEAESWTV